MRAALIAVLVWMLMLTSCAPFNGLKMNGISIGMSKADVILALGKPKKTGGTNDIEVLHYVENTGWGQHDYYFVRLVDGKVESHGIERVDDPVTEDDPPLKTNRN